MGGRKEKSFFSLSVNPPYLNQGPQAGALKNVYISPSGSVRWLDESQSILQRMNFYNSTFNN